MGLSAPSRLPMGPSMTNFLSGASAGSWDQARRELKCVLQAGEDRMMVGCLCWANGLVTRGSRGNQGETSNPKG